MMTLIQPIYIRTDNIWTLVTIVYLKKKLGKLQFK